MTSIRIPVPLALLATGAAITAAIVTQLPELKRYMKVRSMD